MEDQKKGKIETVCGTVVEFTTNTHEDVHGVIVKTNDGEEEIKFPPHTAGYIMEICPMGNLIAATLCEAEKHANKPQHSRLINVKNMQTAKEFTLKSVPPPNPVTTEETVNFNITAGIIKTGKKGEITGIVDGNNFIHIDINKFDGVMNQLSSGKGLSVKAAKRNNDTGFVNRNNHNVYHAEAIAINEAQVV